MFFIFQLAGGQQAQSPKSTLRTILDQVRLGSISQKQAIRTFMREAGKADAQELRNTFRQLWAETVGSGAGMDDRQKGFVADFLLKIIKEERVRGGGKICDHSLAQIAQWQLSKFATNANMREVSAELQNLYNDIKDDPKKVENFNSGAIRAMESLGASWNENRFEMRPDARHENTAANPLQADMPASNFTSEPTRPAESGHKPLIAARENAAEPLNAEDGKYLAQFLALKLKLDDLPENRLSRFWLNGIEHSFLHFIAEEQRKRKRRELEKSNRPEDRKRLEALKEEILKKQTELEEILKKQHEILDLKRKNLELALSDLECSSAMQ